MLFTTFAFLLVGLTTASIAYYLVCIFAAMKFFSEARRCCDGKLPPATILIPLCGTDFEAYENHASFCRQTYPSFQIVFGVHDGNDASVPVVRKLMADFPDRDIELVISPEAIGENPKVNNLHNMLVRAKHEVIILVDSDIRVGPDCLAVIVPQLSDEGVGLVTCFYRAGKALNGASALESVGITGEFAPGVLVAWLTEGMSFALGALIATTRKKLRSIGGFEAIADYLADDFMLGNLMHKAGYEVRLSPYVVETLQPPMRFWSMLKHQIRWARGIRACRPLGHLGSLVTHGTALAVLCVIANQASTPSLLLLAATLIARLTMGWVVGAHFLRDVNLGKNLWLLPIRDLLSFALWCVSLFGKEVEWRGQLFKIVGDGKITPVQRGL